MSNKLRQTFKQYAASNNIVYKNVINFLKYHGLYDETWDKCCIHKSFDKITFVLLHPLTHDDSYKLQVTFFVENSVPKFVEVAPNEDTYGYHKRFDINDDRDFVFNFYTNVKRSFEYTVSWDKSVEQKTETLLKTFSVQNTCDTDRASLHISRQFIPHTIRIHPNNNIGKMLLRPMKQGGRTKVKSALGEEGLPLEYKPPSVSDDFRIKSLTVPYQKIRCPPCDDLMYDHI